MFRKCVITTILMALIAVPLMAEDLYKVTVINHDNAEELSELGIDPLLRIENGYLVLTKKSHNAAIEKSNLEYQLIASGVDRDHLALDISIDGSVSSKFQVIYDDNGVRVLKIEPNDFSNDGTYTGLAKIQTENIKISYKEPRQKIQLSFEKDLDFDSLISLVEQDSLESYIYALEAFPPRVTGSAADYASRNWCYNKFVEFGYDSVLLDSFVYSSNNVQNIIAYKIGNTYPDHHIIIGAHKDAVSGSPGADDNGSGTAGVLEMARILKDIPTEMTIVFALYTGEEQGLNGSWHHANAAAAAGDSIVAMLNMDMIAFINNSTQAKLYHGSDNSWAQLWISLADSLTAVNLSGVLTGSSSGSDHYPYQQNGYDVIFLHEYVFSSVYHSPQDNSSYMDFVYFTKMVKGMLACAYEIDRSYIPVPGLLFSYPGGVPDYLVPNATNSFQVQVTGSSGGLVVPGSGKLTYKIDGHAPITINMTDLGGDLYEAVFPNVDCDDTTVTFYVRANEATTGTIYNPDPADPFSAVVATDANVAFEDDFETNKGWTISGGQWSRGNPTGGGGSYGGPDPSSGHNGSSNVFGYNLSGDYANSIPEYHLTSPAIDCSGISGIKLKFWRWLGVEQPSYDHAYIRVSNNGTAWTTIWTNNAEVTDYDWQEMNYDISAYADNQSTVYIRFTMGVTDGAWTYCGWNIDDFTVTGYECNDLSLIVTSTSLPDWTINVTYSQQLEASGGVGLLTWTDKYGDLSETGLSLASDGLLSGNPVSSGIISFTAMVTDEVDSTAEKLFSFEINPAVDISTLSLPDWTAGFPYSQQLDVTGGTGTKTWSDKYNDLNETGITLSSNGLLSGSPLAGSFSFTAVATDNVGGVDEQSYSFNVNDPLSITTPNLPDGFKDTLYSQQMTASGGTGTIVWSDKNGDLAGWGLSLSSTGLLTGNPTDTGEIIFTSYIEDNIGANTEQVFIFNISLAYICGDADNDGEGPLVDDLVLLVNYLFKGGDAPPIIEAANADGIVNNGVPVDVADLVFLVNYLFKGGPAPTC